MCLERGLVLVVLLVSAIIFTFLVIRSNKSVIVGCLFLIPFLILFIPAITKRLHDIRLSGWICLAWFLITPIALYGYVISLYLLVAGTDSVFALSTETVRLLSLILSTVHILTILLLLFKPSTKTTNKYGPVPEYKSLKTKIKEKIARLKEKSIGRINRKEFLLPGLFVGMVLPTILLLLLFSIGVIVVEILEYTNLFITFPLFLILMSSLITYPLLPSIIKRLHDIGLSGWFSVIIPLTMPAVLYTNALLVRFITTIDSDISWTLSNFSEDFFLTGLAIILLAMSAI